MKKTVSGTFVLGVLGLLVGGLGRLGCSRPDIGIGIMIFMSVIAVIAVAYMIGDLISEICHLNW